MASIAIHRAKLKCIIDKYHCISIRAEENVLLDIFFEDRDAMALFGSQLAIELAELEKAKACVSRIESIVSHNGGQLHVPKLSAEECNEDRALDKRVGDDLLVADYLRDKGRL